MAKYVRNVDLLRAFKESKEEGEITRELIDMFSMMVEGIAKRMAYKNPDDRLDCMASGMEDLIKYWDRFNPEKSNNPFAYFTQIGKNGLAKGWKRIHPPKSPPTIPFSHITGDSGNYNI